MTAEQTRALTVQLIESTGALSALAAALRAAQDPAAVSPAVQGQVARVLAAAGFGDAPLDGMPEAQQRLLLSAIQATLLLAVKQALPGDGEGWAHTDEALLQAQGDVSGGFPAFFEGVVVPQLPGLAERLAQQGAAFLDVGVGVASLAINMTREYPGLRVVGIDPWEPSLAVARQRVAAAGAPVELRPQRAEELTDVAAFDLVFFAGPFVPAPHTGAALAAVRRALRPEGWLLFGVLHLGDAPLSSELAQLRTVGWRGERLDPDDALRLVTAAGYRNVRLLPIVPGSQLALVVGQP